MKDKIQIKDLKIEIEGKEIISGLNLDISLGKLSAIMGPNGSGKSTLANVLMGHPKYEVKSGEIIFKGKDLLQMSPDERARSGIYLAFQYPIEIQGVSFLTFMWASYKARFGTDAKIKSIVDFKRVLEEKLLKLGLEKSFSTRDLNSGFSGGEKKRAEIVQMLILEPEFAIMDETDSGLDIDSLKIVADNINLARKTGLGILIITHYQRILDYLNPDEVHVMHNGRILKSGGKELAAQLEKEGYSNIIGQG